MKKLFIFLNHNEVELYIAIVIIFIMTSIGCSNRNSYVPPVTLPENKIVDISADETRYELEDRQIIDKISYIHDNNTGLCFAIVKCQVSQQGHSNFNITCVPCDSLKRVRVIQVEKNQ